MTTYIRNIKPLLIAAWTLFLIGLITLAYFALMEQFQYSGFILLTMLLLGFFKFTGLNIQGNNITIDRFSFFALKRKQFKVGGHYELKPELFVNGDLDYYSSPDTGTWLDAIVLLVPFLYNKYWLWVKKQSNIIVWRIRINKEEYEIIKKLITVRGTLPITACL
jgi:hypothetical protein